MYDEDKTHSLPLYWISELSVIMGYDPTKISEMEKDLINIFEWFAIMGCETCLDLREIF